MKKFFLAINKKQIIYFVLILIISLVNLRFFFQPGIFRAHDIENHLARIANYYLAVKDGSIPPRWAKNLNHKFGYPVFNYNYPLANILSYPLIVAGFNIETSLKIILFLAYFFSGIFFYFWAKNYFSKTSSFVGAVFYLCAPYQFLDLYVRGVVGENLSFALIPAVLYFLSAFVSNPSRIKLLGLIVSTSAFSLSHNIMVLLFTPVIFTYWLFLLKANRQKKFLKIALIGLILGFLLTSFFWIPALGEQKFVTLNAFNKKNFYQNHFVFFKQLLFSPWQYGFSVAGEKDTMSFQIGPIHFLVFIFLIIKMLFLVLKKKSLLQKPKDIFLFGSAGLFLLSVFLMLSVSKFIWQLIPVLGYLQFPWRFLAVAIFSSSLLAAALADKYKILGIGLAFICFIYIQPFVKPFFWGKKPDMTYYDFLFTTTVRHENNPIWFREENVNKFKPKFLSDSGLVKFNELKWKTGKHIYEITVPEKTTIWEHTAYFPGWKAFVDGKEIKINYNNNKYPGLINFKVAAGKHFVVVKFTQKTLFRILGNSLSILTLITAFLMLKSFCLNEVNKKNE